MKMLLLICMETTQNIVTQVNHFYPKHRTSTHNGMERSQDLFWWKWLTGQAMAALNYK